MIIKDHLEVNVCHGSLKTLTSLGKMMYIPFNGVNYRLTHTPLSQHKESFQKHNSCSLNISVLVM